MLEHPSIPYAERYGVRPSSRSFGSLQGYGQSAGKTHLRMSILRDFTPRIPSNWDHDKVRSSWRHEVCKIVHNKTIVTRKSGFPCALLVRVLPNQQRKIFMKFRPARMV